MPHNKVRRGAIAGIATAVAALLALAPAAIAADSDGDALPNKWETKKTPSGLNLKKLGADPKHKDIFVEMDFATNQLRKDVGCKDLNDLVTAFKKGPVDNPDGKQGITLHIDAGLKCSTRSYDFGGSNGTNVSSCSDFNHLQSMSAKRIRSFHLAAIVDDCGGGEGGAATNTGSIQSINFMPFVFMHELGHNLGLTHGGTLEVNHMGVMGPMNLTSAEDACGHAEHALDYQRIHVDALDEAALSETDGLTSAGNDDFLHDYCVGWRCPADAEFAPDALVYEWPADGSIDWNCSDFFLDDIDTGTVAVDINGDGDDAAPNDVIPATEPEWPLLDYSSSGLIGPP